MYSCVNAGPPCNNKIFIRGLLPMVFVQTLKLPTGVSIAIILIPASCTPLSLGAKYSATVMPVVWESSLHEKSINIYNAKIAMEGFLINASLWLKL
jgi:hypothetical protein